MEPSRSSNALRHVGSWLFGVPWVTRNVALLCVLLHVVVMAVAPSTSTVALRFCLAPDYVTRGLALHRVVVSPFLHLGVIHLIFNLLTWTSNNLESAMGSQRFLNLLVVSIVVSAALQCVLHEALRLLSLHSDDLLWGLLSGCSVGLSGACFTVMVVESAHDRAGGGAASRRSIGPFVVPSSAAPWVMLVALQLFMPGHS